MGMVSTFSATSCFLDFFTFLAALALMHTSSAKTIIAYLDVFIVVKRIYFSMSSSSMVKVRALKGLMLPMSCVP